MRCAVRITAGTIQRALARDFDRKHGGFAAQDSSPGAEQFTRGHTWIWLGSGTYNLDAGTCRNAALQGWSKSHISLLDRTAYRLTRGTRPNFLFGKSRPHPTVRKMGSGAGKMVTTRAARGILRRPASRFDLQFPRPIVNR